MSSCRNWARRVAEGKILTWFKKPRRRRSPKATIFFEVETDKVTVEVQADCRRAS